MYVKEKNAPYVQYNVYMCICVTVTVYVFLSSHVMCYYGNRHNVDAIIMTIERARGIT